MNKTMNKATTVIVLAIMIILALFLGFLLVNKGDGPVSGMILADKGIGSTEDYNNVKETKEAGVFLIVTNEFNEFREAYQSNILVDQDLYATVYFVECPKGSEFIGKWVQDDTVIDEQTKALTTEPEGVMTYVLAGENVVQGSYTFELYEGERLVFEKTFSIE